jgi:hypothetical protein
VLELAEEVISRISALGAQAEALREGDPTLKELRYGGGENIVIYGNRLSDWIDCMGEWGSRWHSRLIQRRIAMMPTGILFLDGQVRTFEAIDELVVTLRPMQPPKFSWRFFFEDMPVEVFTDPLTLEVYKAASEEEMQEVELERDYVRLG